MVVGEIVNTLTSLGGVAGGFVAGEKYFNASNDLFGSFVAITGDAHQAKVAQDIFRQETRYERSQQIREDIRDVNKMMMESIQTHVILGSIVLSACFSMLIEAYPDFLPNRAAQAYYIFFASWAATFTIMALWLALRFQMRTSAGARERLLRKHRYFVPDDLVVGRMGGRNVVDKVSQVHGWLLSSINPSTSDGETPEVRQDTKQPIFPSRVEIPCRVRVESFGTNVDIDCGLVEPLDVEPLRKGMHCWLHGSGAGCSPHIIMDVPFFLFGETLVRRPWFCAAGDDALKPLHLRVHGEATLYVAGQCRQPDEVGGHDPRIGDRSSDNPPGMAAGLRKALFLDGPVPAWSPEELPVVLTGFHETWRGDSGFGEFQRVEGFSINVQGTDIELPLYKVVLAAPENESVDAIVQWNFQAGCEALLVVVREGQVHCKEEDWPLAEFNIEIQRAMPLRNFASLYLKLGVNCLVIAAAFVFLFRYMKASSEHARSVWWYEVLLAIAAYIPAIGAVGFIPISSRKTEEALSVSSMLEQQAFPSRKMTSARIEPAANLKASFPKAVARTEAASPQVIARPEEAEYICNVPSFYQPEREAKLATYVPVAPPPRTNVSARIDAAGRLPTSPGPFRQKVANAAWRWRRGNRKRSPLLCWTVVIKVFFVGSFIAVSIFFSSGQGATRQPHATLPELVSSVAVPVPDSVSSSNGPSRAERMPNGILWTVWDVAWPAFFKPTALAFDPSRETLYIAAGRVLRTFGRRSGRHGTWVQIAETLLLVSPACGLDLLGAGGGTAPRSNGSSELVVIFNTGAHQKLQISDATDGASFREGSLGLVTLPSNEEEDIHLSTNAPTKFSSMALLDVAGSLATSGPFEALAVGTSVADRGLAKHVLFCRSDGAASKVGQFIELSSLTGFGQVSNSSDIAIHVCAIGDCMRNEPAIWLLTTENGTSADRSARVSGVGLQSGKHLAEFELQGLPPGYWHAAALSGNSTHLVAVLGATATTRLPRQDPALVVSAQYASLLEGLATDSANEL